MESNSEEPEDVRENSGGVGALLRASRLRLGDDLRYVAETLHIRFIYLEAIEDSRYDDLPGPAYAVGFIRSYADYLGLDSGEVVRRYKAESTGGAGETKLVFPVPIPESSIPGGAIIFVGVVVAILTYGVWYVSTAKDGFLAGLVSQVPERLSEQKLAEEPDFKPEPVTPETVEKTKEPIPKIVVEVAEREEPAEAAEQAPVEIEKEVPEPVTQPVEQAAPEPTPGVSEQAEPVVHEVGEAQQTVAAETEATTGSAAVAVEKIERVEEVVSTETDANADQPASEPAPAPAEEPTVAEPVVGENTAGEPAAVEHVDAPAAVQAVAEDEQPADEPAESVTPTETASAPTADASTAVNQVYGAENENSRILVRARKNSWIQVRDNNANRLLLTRLLRAGDSYRVPDQPGLVLLTGNAGALEILVDGETVPDLGEAGKVRRNVTLDPDLLRQGTAAE